MCRTGWGGAGVTARSIRSFPGRSWNGQHTSSTQHERYAMRTLNMKEVEQVGGGLFKWDEIAAGAGVAALGFLATGGIGDIALGIIWGAGTIGEIGTAGFGIGAAGAGGYMMGAGKF